MTQQMNYLIILAIALGGTSVLAVVVFAGMWRYMREARQHIRATGDWLVAFHNGDYDIFSLRDRRLRVRAGIARLEHYQKRLCALMPLLGLVLALQIVVRLFSPAGGWFVVANLSVGMTIAMLTVVVHDVFFLRRIRLDLTETYLRDG